MDNVRIAACQFPISFHHSWASYEDKAARMSRDAVNNGATMLLFPEYASLEMVSIFGEEIYSDLHRQLGQVQERLDDYKRLYARLAEELRAYILAPSLPVAQLDGTFRNIAYLFAPDGSCDYQEKLMMTRFESEKWFIHPGQDVKVFETDFGRIGVNICYDSEFPIIARRQCEAGATLILVPSCTDTLAGYHRVRIGSQARALENQCFVAHSPIVGEAAWSPALDVNIGQAGIYTPIDSGFPPDGVLAMGEQESDQWVYADLNLKHIEQIRRDGQVLNFNDWEKQVPLMQVPVKVREMTTDTPAPEVNLAGRYERHRETAGEAAE